MKYLFSVSDLVNNCTKLYSIKAESPQRAEEIFARKFLPYVPKADFAGLYNSLADGMDIIISILGPMDQIEEL